jgi:DmsE family decaheme c-type cytochrome
MSVIWQYKQRRTHSQKEETAMEKRSLKVALLTAALSLVACLAFANEKCKECHADIVAKHAATLHGKAGKSCDACHGGADAHLASGNKKDIVTFGKGDAKKQDAQCLGCHAKNQNLMFWDNSKHKTEDVSCVSCHSIHKAAKPTAKQPDNCFTCHKDVKAQANKFSHHPIIEGKIKCSDCHNPHGTLTKGMIKAETVNLLCYTCHADKRGPFLHEHPPAAEDCMSCHAPHGSKAYRLTIEKTPNLCMNCHTSGHGTPPSANAGFVGAATVGRGSISRNCALCHVKVHGTNSPGSNGQYFLR